MNKIYETKTFLIQTSIVAIITYLVIPWFSGLNKVKEWSGQYYSCPLDSLCPQVVVYWSEMIADISIYVLTLLIIVHILFFIRQKFKNRK